MTRARVGELLARAERRLTEAGIAEARRDALRLLAHALGVDRLGLLALGRDAPVEADGFEPLLERRARREPLSFIVGRQGVLTLELAVSPDTLIPRADSETLVEALLEARPDRRSVTRLLDLGTGTGCLLLAACRSIRSLGVGVDRSEPAAGWRGRTLGRTASRRGAPSRAATGRADPWACRRDREQPAPTSRPRTCRA